MAIIGQHKLYKNGKILSSRNIGFSDNNEDQRFYYKKRSNGVIFSGFSGFIRINPKFLFNIYLLYSSNICCSNTLIILAFSYFTIISMAIVEFKKIETCYKIGIILFTITVILGIIPIITYNFSITLLLEVIQIILLIYFYMNLKKPEVAQKAINLVLILAIINLIFTGIGHFTTMIPTFTGLIVRGTYALGYYLATNVKVE